MSTPVPAEDQPRFCEGQMQMLVGRERPAPYPSRWRVYDDLPSEVRATYGGRLARDDVRDPEKRGIRLGRNMLRLALRELTTEDDTTAGPVKLPEGQFVDLTTVTAGADIHWRVPHDKLAEFLDRADSEIPDPSA